MTMSFLRKTLPTCPTVLCRSSSSHTTLVKSHHCPFYENGPLRNDIQFTRRSFAHVGGLDGVAGGVGQKHTTYTRSALSAGPLPYERGWAWQHVLLDRRLRYLRLKEQVQKQRVGGNGDGLETNQSAEIIDCDNEEGNKDWLLLFEHNPVYTLGRGASEEHLTFLQNVYTDGAVENDEVLEDMRRRLSRKYRGEDASRLNVDRLKQIGLDENCVNKEVDALSATRHNPVYAPNGAPIYRIERGGEVTYHGPGQLVIYPLLNLKHPAFQQDLHWYLRQIEEVIIQTLREFDIESKRDEINTGVWVGENKIAAVGVSSSRWITTHGCAINVLTNLDHFDESIITPCGIEERGVTSIQRVWEEMGEGRSCPSLEEVASVAVNCFGRVFGVEVSEGEPIK